MERGVRAIPDPITGAEPCSGLSSRSSEQQGSLLPTSVAPNQPEAPIASAGEVWAARLSLVVFVLFCLELGLVLAVLPWTHIWTENNLLMNYPRLRVLAANPFVRGVFSGLGLIDLWIGIWEVIAYRERKVL
jgi:hypothetical protein